VVHRIALFLVGIAALLMAPAAIAVEKPVLVVLTSHAQLGDTGRSTGFFLGELTHPLEVFEKDGVPVEFASIKGGEPPVDGLDLDDEINARYWNNADFRAKLGATKKLSEVDPENYAGVFFSGGHGTMWDFPDDETVQRWRVKSTSPGRPSARCVMVLPRWST